MLTVTGLSCGRGLPLLAGVSFAVDPGEVLVLRGPNGVGKTTLLRTLAGLMPALDGKVAYADGTAAYASHADGVKATLTARENLQFWAAVYGQDLQRETAERFDLAGLMDRAAGTFSAGQKRRLGLARLDVIGRELLFLDEPTVSLDAASVALFARWMTDVHLARGGAAVIATHIDIGLPGRVLDLSGHIAVNDWPEDVFG